MFSQHPLAYLLGLILLSLAMVFDWIDGWFAVRYLSHSRLGPWVDRVMDRIVLSIIFPVLVAGLFWRYGRLSGALDFRQAQFLLLHALFVLAICVLVLMRDQAVQFLRNFALGQEDVESSEVTRTRTLLSSPLAMLLYAYAFYLPARGWEWLYRGLDWINDLPLRVWLVLEIAFLLVNIGSATVYMRRYGPLALDDICADDERLRRRILAVLPNTITLLNGVLGIIAIVLASVGQVREALFLLIGAAFFDRLDGVLARRLGLTDPPGDPDGRRHIQLGAILDDISDFVSFCIAPAVIYALVIPERGDSPMGELLPTLVPWVYAVAGGARLLYFTLDKHPVPGFFKGMPVPAAALLVMGPIAIAAEASGFAPGGAAAWHGAATAVMLLAALAMNLYPVRYLHIGRLMGRRPILLYSLLLLTIATIFTPYFGFVVLAFLLFYLLSPIFTWRIDPSEAVRESRS
jgi:phosphatidylserine synthase